VWRRAYVLVPVTTFLEDQLTASFLRHAPIDYRSTTLARTREVSRAIADSATETLFTAESVHRRHSQTKLSLSCLVAKPHIAINLYSLCSHGIHRFAVAEDPEIWFLYNYSVASQTQEVQLSQRGRAMLHVIECFAKSLKSLKVIRNNTLE